MFTNKNEAMKNTETTAAINMIGAGTVITGDIQSKGDIRVDGTLKGSVNTSGKVVLGKDGVIEGDVVCTMQMFLEQLKQKFQYHNYCL